MISKIGTHSTLRDRLKRETADEHVRLETTLNLMRPDITRGELAVLLGRFYGYFATCEEQLKFASDEMRSFLSDRTKRPLLEADLEFLGLTREAILALPHCQLPVARSTPEVLGRWYVLEGSTLGGQFVARHLRKQLDLPEHGGCRYFLSYGAEVGAKWKEYCELLNQVESQHDADVAIGWARIAFATMADWLSGNVEPE